MKQRVIFISLMLTLLMVCSFSIALAFLQVDPVTTPAQTTGTNMPWQMWIPFVLGFLGHWYKKYVEDKVTNSFFNYFATGVLGTITSVIGGFITFAGMYAMNPSAYQINLPGIIGVFLISYSWDSLANAPGQQQKASG